MSVAKKKFYIIFYLIFCLTFFLNVKAFSTHITGGEISYEALPGQGTSFKIMVVTYTNDHSPVPEASGKIDFGDGSGSFDLNDVFKSSSHEVLTGGIRKSTFLVEHTYSSSGNYTIFYIDLNRGPGIINAINATNSPYYMESNLKIDPFLGINSSPEFLSTPNFFAKEGKKYIENPLVEDKEKDSIAFHLLIPREANTVEVPGYLFPQQVDDSNGASANEAGTGNPILVFDKENQQFVWDAPVVAGKFLIAYKIEEWRKINGEWYMIGNSMRDYLITVEESENNRPFLIIPKDTVLEAGKLLEVTVLAQDPDGDDVTIESSGAPYQLSFLPAEYAIQGNQLNFSWQTYTDHISDKPYEVEFKAYDHEGNNSALYDFKIWKIFITTVASSTPKSEKNILSIFPNPSSGMVNIRSTFRNNFEISIFDLKGKLIYENKNLSEQVLNINLEHIVEGIYIVKFKGDSTLESKKLMILK